MSGSGRGRLDAFFLPPEEFHEPFVLTGGEAHHCARVLRKAAGEQVRVFDGTGREGVFTIDAVGKDRVALSPVSLAAVPPPPGAVHLAAGFSRSARRDFFLEKAVELGASGILFWQAARTQGRMPDAPKDAWTAGLVAACRDRFDRRYLLWEDVSCRRRLRVDDVAAPGEALFVLGPEGGLTDAEATLFIDAGYAPVSLGSRVLRWETAALAVLALGLAATDA
ncbi:RsmE family RNA methyltransferase [Solidesulfovibrio sp.]|uniref:RsmE family RNA methyltransferase n=1 Tax=Solidesulfovibrio sp. TaxID=2910990 RepID=UPI002B1E9538|nr:RsmE family RNA methyltransferase [Solidesulfovibrio sp.]MEA5089253.1 RsmE family RNA methyltransferase [Solidesulfovibrio sp.]